MATNRARVDFIEDPPLARALFSDVRLSWIWLIVRVYLGYQWIEAGLHKITAAGWMETGASLKGYWTSAVAVPATGSPKIYYDWYRGFLQYLLDQQSYVWFAKVVAVGELLVGIGLVVGALVGIAAIFGALMNLNFMLASSASTNPVLFLIAIFLILAWKTAGYWGADRFILPLLGTPWTKGLLVRRITSGGTQVAVPEPAGPRA